MEGSYRRALLNRGFESHSLRHIEFAREVIALLKLLTRLQKAAAENKLLFDVIAGAIYVCAALAMMGFVFGWPLQGLLATSGIIALVLGLALQSTLSDLRSSRS
jgi:small-conductance mechanosensitive channel